MVSVAIITFVEVTFGGSDEEVNGSDEVVSGSDEEVSDVCGNNKEVCFAWVKRGVGDMSI